jgi:hypothetical protein
MEGMGKKPRRRPPRPPDHLAGNHHARRPGRAARPAERRIALTMEVYTQVPDKTTRDALKRLSDLLGGPQDDAEATAETDDTGPATEDDADPPRTAA